jgi:hypothetical protein
MLSQIFELLRRQPLDGHLWIVSEKGVRIRPGIAEEEDARTKDARREWRERNR